MRTYDFIPSLDLLRSRCQGWCHERGCLSFAIDQLARQFSFRNLGGTSVGAIAAAAAEYSRRNGGEDNFHWIGKPGKDLSTITFGKKTKLLNLFQLNRNTKTLFASDQSLRPEAFDSTVALYQSPTRLAEMVGRPLR
ncbi:MAG: hypothetical protein ACXWWH_09700 [Nitrospira sp.]